ncbi:unnamed protein product [Staurois parvus]|uniref:Uncharacterized protein n=1 Tax=Staurois parvus TaxID=386267 RepID=A0ABN9D7E2_9NEOB|nr:unnamed protein product [Staurois parvus]
MSVHLMERIWSGRSGISTAAVSEYRAGRSALQRDLLFLYPAARCLPGFCSVGTGHDSRGCQVRMRKKRCFL